MACKGGKIMVFRIAFSLLIAAGLVYLIWLLRGVMLTPIRTGANGTLELVVRVAGPAPELEQTVNGLLWLTESGTLDGRVLIIDEGMDDSTALVAARLARHSRRVELRRREELCKQTETASGSPEPCGR